MIVRQQGGNTKLPKAYVKTGVVKQQQTWVCHDADLFPGRLTDTIPESDRATVGVIDQDKTDRLPDGAEPDSAIGKRYHPGGKIFNWIPFGAAIKIRIYRRPITDSINQYIERKWDHIDILCVCEPGI
jgi:hypothetical protein